MGSKKSIILYSNADRDVGLNMTQAVALMLEKHGRNVVICPVFDVGADESVPLSCFSIARFEDAYYDAEMIITFGGDGTILSAARVAAGHGTPILGINMGGKGFMAELEVDDIDLISSAALGEYDTEHRMMLDAEVIRDGEVAHRDFALNDIVVRGYNRVINLKLYGDGHIISSFSGDGAVVATPTGSTAYSLAAGGPIVEPSAHNIIVTPICAHVLEAKPFVLVSDRRVSIEVGHEKHNPSYLSADGSQRVELFSGDTVMVSKSSKITRLVRLSNRSFYSRVSEKLGEKV